MLKSNSSPATPQPSNAELIELALSGKFPGLLVKILTPGLTDRICLDIEANSKLSTSA